MTQKARISCDVRWQPKSEPVDKRYVGEVFEWLKTAKKAGLHNKDNKNDVGKK